MAKSKKAKKGLKAEDANIQFPWLTNAQKRILREGGYFDSEGAIHNSEGCIRCTSIVQSTQKRCKNFAVPGELYCMCHGGVVSRHTHGKQRIYSPFIQDATLKALYNAGDTGEQVEGIREELGLLRALLAKVISETGGDMDVKDLKGVASIIGEVRQLVNECTKADLKMGQLIELSKIGMIVKELAGIVCKYVTDEEILKKIADGFDKIILPATFASTSQPERTEPLRAISAISGEVRD